MKKEYIITEDMIREQLGVKVSSPPKDCEDEHSNLDKSKESSDEEEEKGII